MRRKLQKLEIEPDSPASRLVGVAYQVFNNQDTEEEKSEDKKVWRQVHLLAVALQCQLVWTNCPQKLSTPVSDCWPTPRDSKARKADPISVPYVNKRDTGRENTLDPPTGDGNGRYQPLPSKADDPNR